MAAPPKRVIPTLPPQIRPVPARALQLGLKLGRDPQSTLLLNTQTIKPLPSRAISSGATTTTSGNSGSNVLSEPIGHLIQHIKQYDPMLYEALQRLGLNTQVINNIVGNLNNPTAQFYSCTVDIYDTTVGNVIAPMQPVYGTVTGNTQQAIIVEAVLTNVITADLVLRVNNINGATTQVVGEFDIPNATPVGTVVSLNTFMNPLMSFGSVLSFDITASDGSTNKYGVASYNIWWVDSTDAS